MRYAMTLCVLLASCAPVLAQDAPVEVDGICGLVNFAFCPQPPAPPPPLPDPNYIPPPAPMPPTPVSHRRHSRHVRHRTG